LKIFAQVAENMYILHIKGNMVKKAGGFIGIVLANFLVNQLFCLF